MDCPGRLTIDLQTWIERNLPPNKYANYKLETVAQKELKEGKDVVVRIISSYDIPLYVDETNFDFRLTFF